jgi:hypothetical protein
MFDMKEASDFEEFLHWYVQASILYTTPIAIRRSAHMIIASIPEEIDLTIYWAPPPEHDLFWVHYNNFNLPISE